MASYFVKTSGSGGSDANNGTTWALAKATVQAGLTLCTTAGDNLYVAPGRYYEVNLDPHSAGSRAAPKSFIGDWTSTIADGGTNLSGVAPGYVILDASKQTGNKGFSMANSVMKLSTDKWVYWNVKNFFMTGGLYCFLIWPLTSTISHDSVTYENIIGWSTGDKGFQIGNCKIDSDTGTAITINNCIGISQGTLGANSIYEAGLYLQTPTATQYTNPSFIFNRCFFRGNNTGFTTASNSVNRIRATFNNCTIMAAQPRVSHYAIHNVVADGTYCFFIFNDCFISGYRASVSGVTAAGTTSTFNRCKFYVSDTDPAQTSLLSPPLHGELFTLMAGASIVDANSSNGTFPDIWGNAMYGNADFGAQELQLNQQLVYPMASLYSTSTGRTWSPFPAGRP